MSKMILTEEQQNLITENYGLAKDFINKTLEEKKIPINLIDDFKSNIFLKFCYSALKYESDRGFKFSTYAYGGFNYGLKSILDKKIEVYDVLDKSYEILENEENNCIENKFLYDFINKAGLKDRNKEIIIDYYINKLSFYKIGEKYNLTKEATRLIVKKVLKKLKRYAERNKLEVDDFYGTEI